MKEILARYYCDRCGKEIPNKKSNELVIAGCSVAIQICTEGWNYIDLCDSCIDSLEKWFLMRGDNNGKA